MRRKTETILVVVILAALVIAGLYMVAPAFGKQQAPVNNVAQVYITTWNIEPIGDQGIDVQFQLSLDLNGDGTFEVVRSSEVFANTYVELAPFKLGGPIPASISKFSFKVEVFRVVDGVRSPLSYSNDGMIPVNDGINQEDSSNAWSFENLGSSGTSMAVCNITYSYYVN
jgi:hypothetical protein